MMRGIGIDIGSTAVKAAFLDGDKFSFHIQPTGWNPKESAESAAARLLENVESPENIKITATGYGRKMLECAFKTVTEITCHAAGASFMYHGTETILDIGGQDSKVIVTDRNGNVRDFLMNDKCAAGTGRFLQNMAVLLEYTLDDFSLIPRDAKIQPISNMCTVFAESEVISLLAGGTPKESVALGLLDSIAKRASAMITRISSEGEVVFTGGGALNSRLAELIEKHLGRKVIIPKHPQCAGAIGAALIASSQK